MLSYLLVRRINEGLPTAFRINDNRCYLFTQNSCGSRTDANALFDLSEDTKRDLWILTDEVIEDAGWFQKDNGWFVVLAASPTKVVKSYQWVKERNTGTRYMTYWDWEEIVAASR